MSLITRCPACGTLFKVVPDQLRVSDGWVRCGQCEEVFDANASLQELGTVTAGTQTPVQAPTPPVSETAAVSASEPESAPEPEPEPEPESEPELEQAHAHEPHVDAFLDQSPAALAQSPDHERIDIDIGALLQAHVPEDRSVASATPADRSEPVPGFMRTAPAGVRAPSRWLRWVLVSLALLLSLLLAAQVLLQQRNAVAAQWPAAKGALQRVCELIGCRLAPPQRIEAIAIDSSAFTKVHADVYLLAVTLKNAASTEVAMPALELTLTDTQDQVLLRRVLQVNAFAAQRSTLAASGDFSFSLPVEAKAGAGVHVAGYRLLAFYPQ